MMTLLPVPDIFVSCEMSYAVLLSASRHYSNHHLVRDSCVQQETNSIRNSDICYFSLSMKWFRKKKRTFLTVFLAEAQENKHQYLILYVNDKKKFKNCCA